MTASTIRGPSDLILDKIVKHLFFFAMVTKRFFPLHIQNQASNSERSPSILKVCHINKKKVKTLKLENKKNSKYPWTKITRRHEQLLYIYSFFLRFTT